MLCMGSKLSEEISNVPFEISHKILNPFTAKYVFYEGVNILTNYDILSLSDTATWLPAPPP